MNMKYKRVFALGIGIIALGFALNFMPEIDSGLKATIFASGTAMLVIALIVGARTKEGEVLTDERTQRITDKSLAYSWWLTYLLIASLLWADYYKIADLTVPNTLAIIFFFMVFSSSALKMLYKRKGEL
jgi:hypothetical protein